jgi:HEPN domain-containing protein
MQLDPMARGRRWLEQAQADRQGAQLLLDGGSYHLACFVAQQVAEKALKAFLYAAGEEVVIGHSVEALARWAAEYDEAFEILRQAVAPLDAYYIPTRYPNGLPHDSIPARVYTRSAAEETVRMADQVLDLVQDELHEMDQEASGDAHEQPM